MVRAHRDVALQDLAIHSAEVILLLVMLNSCDKLRCGGESIAIERDTGDEYIMIHFLFGCLFAALWFFLLLKIYLF